MRSMKIVWVIILGVVLVPILACHKKDKDLPDSYWAVSGGFAGIGGIIKEVRKYDSNYTTFDQFRQLITNYIQGIYIADPVTGNPFPEILPKGQYGVVLEWQRINSDNEMPFIWGETEVIGKRIFYVTVQGECHVVTTNHFCLLTNRLIKQGVRLIP